MQYLKSVMEAEGVQTLVNENDAIINNLVNQTITDITTENITIVRDNLEQFIVEGDLLETYEDISTWASEDVQYYMEAISEVLADQELTQEQKVAIISNPDQFLSTEIKSGSFGSAYSAARKGDDYQAKTKRERAGKVVGKGVKAVTGAGKWAGKVVGKGVKAVTGAGKWAGKKIASAHKAVKGAFKKSPTDTDRFNQFVKFRSKQGGGRSAI